MQRLTAMPWRRSLAVTLLLLATVSAAAQSPSAPWQTFETEHFRIHFPRPFEAWARRAASRIESINARVTEYVGYSPKGPIDVVVEDPAAAANGVAFPFLDRPVVVLWTTPLEAESSLGYYNDWPDLVLTHEMTHIVHLLRPRSQSRGLMTHFSPLPVGPLLLKSPRWVIEGYATLVEGALTGSGRPEGSFRAMVVRRLAMEGKLPEYRQLSFLAGRFGGAAPYLVCSTYLEWLEGRQGPGSLRRLWKRLASRGGGGFMTAFKAVFGESPVDLYDRFRAETTARAMEDEKRLKSAGLIEGEIWQRLEGATASPQVNGGLVRLVGGHGHSAHGEPRRAPVSRAKFRYFRFDVPGGTRGLGRDRALALDHARLRWHCLRTPGRDDLARLPRLAGDPARSDLRHSRTAGRTENAGESSPEQGRRGTH